MNNKICYKCKKFFDLAFICLLLLCLFCSNAFAEKFNVVIKNDTEETLEISDVVKNYSKFDEDCYIEDMQKLGPAQKTISFRVAVYGVLYLEKKEKINNTLDGIYFRDTKGNNIEVVWGRLPGLTPDFGPLDRENKVFITKLSEEGISQDPTYVFTIKKNPKL